MIKKFFTTIFYYCFGFRPYAIICTSARHPFEPAFVFTYELLSQEQAENINGFFTIYNNPSAVAFVNSMVQFKKVERVSFWDYVRSY